MKNATLDSNIVRMSVLLGPGLHSLHNDTVAVMLWNSDDGNEMNLEDVAGKAEGEKKRNRTHPIMKISSYTGTL